MTERRVVGVVAVGLLAVAFVCVHWMRIAHISVDVTGATGDVHFEGFTAPQADGRWSVSEQPRVRFDRPLPSALTLRVTGRARAATVGREIAVRVPGGSSQVFRFSLTDSTQEVRLTNPWFASAIAWTIPASQVPATPGKGGDESEPGFALTRLELLP